MAARVLVLATRNPHKLEEVRRILEPLGLEVEPLGDEVVLPPENGRTFAENALGKARAAAGACRRAAIADDSGIEAQALGGAPGVYSARYAGQDASDEENLAKLMRQAPTGSPLRYVCALAFVDEQGSEHVFFGDCAGRMADEPRGSGGFGYDPAFIPEEDGQHRTMAELSEREKDEISHRGRALRAFARWFDG